MINFEEELNSILRDDPLGLLNVKPKSSALTADERLIASFEEINSFIEKHDREPQKSSDIIERRLFSRLTGLRNSSEKAFALKEYDSHSLLKDVEPPQCLDDINSIDDILEGDVLGLLDDEPDPASIFTLKNIPAAREMPDYIARRKPCKEFEKFEPLFKDVHSKLAAGSLVTRPFNSERQITPGEFFICQGQLVLVVNQGNWEKKNFGNVNARLYCVFENGTESNLFLRSLAAAFWKDDFSRQVIDGNQLKLFESESPVSSSDETTGHIYVLRSLSEEPLIKSTKHLYKVGYSTGPVEKRIKDANKDSTYLYSDVEVVAEYQVLNVNPQKLELLLHRFFAEACLNIDAFDPLGKRYSPREWFAVPLHVIQQAIQYIITEEIIQFRFDTERNEIVRKSK